MSIKPIYLITPVGCGHAGFDANQVAVLFKGLLTYENVMLPELFLKVYESELAEKAEKSNELPFSMTKEDNTDVHDGLTSIITFFQKNNIPYDLKKRFELLDSNDNVIAKAELGIEKEKIVFFPFNSQSEATFRNYGYKISDPAEYIQSHNN